MRHQKVCRAAGDKCNLGAIGRYRRLGEVGDGLLRETGREQESGNGEQGKLVHRSAFESSMLPKCNNAPMNGGGPGCLTVFGGKWCFEHSGTPRGCQVRLVRNSINAATF